MRVVLLTKPIRPARAASIRAPGGPPQTRADNAVFVSSTSRTSLLGAVGIDLGLNLLGRHRRRRRLGEALARRVEARQAKLPQALAQELLQRFRIKQALRAGGPSDVVRERNL
jgi:hypothetical protein